MYDDVMDWDLWGLHPANLIDTFATEAEALEAVRELLAAGWSADDLSLGSPHAEGGGAVIEGAELAAQACASEPKLSPQF